MSRSQRCGAWPLDLCHRILATVEQILVGTPHNKSWLFCILVLGGSVLPYEVFVEEQEHDNDGHDHEHEQSNVETQTREPDSPVYKLHCINKFGHPANSTLARILRLGGAKPEIVEAAKRIKCDSCDRARAPKDPPRVGLQDCQNQPHIVLSMVDYATSYHLLRHAQTEWEGGGNTVCRSLDRHVWGPQGIGL